MQISKRRIVKGVVRFLIAGSAGTTITRLIQQNTEPDEEKRFDQARLTAGTAVLSWAVQDLVGRWTDEQIDDVADAYADFKTALKQPAVEE